MKILIEAILDVDTMIDSIDNAHRVMQDCQDEIESILVKNNAKITEEDFGFECFKNMTDENVGNAYEEVKQLLQKRLLNGEPVNKGCIADFRLHATHSEEKASEDVLKKFRDIEAKIDNGTASVYEEGFADGVCFLASKMNINLN